MVRPAHYSQLPEARVFNWNINLIHSLIEFITWRLLNRSKNLRRVTKMSHLSCCKVYQHVIQMSISQTNNVPNHGHDRRRPSITLRHLPPLCCTGAGTPQLSEKVPKMSHCNQCLNEEVMLESVQFCHFPKYLNLVTGITGSKYQPPQSL